MSYFLHVLFRTNEGEGADPRHSFPSAGHSALLPAQALQREAVLHHSSGSEGNQPFNFQLNIFHFCSFQLELWIISLLLLTSPKKPTLRLIKWPRKTTTEQLTAKRTWSSRRRRQRVTKHRRRMRTWTLEGCTQFRRRHFDLFFYICF